MCKCFKPSLSSIFSQRVLKASHWMSEATQQAIVKTEGFLPGVALSSKYTPNIMNRRFLHPRAKQEPAKCDNSVF